MLSERYWDGIAADRPASYWCGATSPPCVVCAGPLLAPGWPRLAARAARLRRGPGPRRCAARRRRPLAMRGVADLSRMSKAEVERIWLPFVPWLTLSIALLPERWRRRGLVVQVRQRALRACSTCVYTTW